VLYCVLVVCLKKIKNILWVCNRVMLYIAMCVCVYLLLLRFCGGHVSPVLVWCPIVLCFYVLQLCLWSCFLVLWKCITRVVNVP
jgi:hypothetical protein